MRRLPLWPPVLVTASMLACTGCDVAAGSLVDPGAWVEADADPLADDVPGDTSCEPGSWYVESGDLEISTAACDYLALQQPLLLDVGRGEAIEIVGWHADLFADEPAEGHLALLAGETVLWEYRVDIPADAAVFTSTVDAPERLRAGEPVTLHLHNHGANTWELVGVEAVGR